MGSSPQKAEDTVRAFVDRVKPDAAGFTAETSLYADGVGLDSLETAELSALLEDELGADPFSVDPMPESLADIVAFYRDVPAEA